MGEMGLPRGGDSETSGGGETGGDWVMGGTTLTGLSGLGSTLGGVVLIVAKTPGDGFPIVMFRVDLAFVDVEGTEDGA